MRLVRGVSLFHSSPGCKCCVWFFCWGRLDLFLLVFVGLVCIQVFCLVPWTNWVCLNCPSLLHALMYPLECCPRAGLFAGAAMRRSWISAFATAWLGLALATENQPHKTNQKAVKRAPALIPCQQNSSQLSVHLQQHVVNDARLRPKWLLWCLCFF